MHDARLLEDVVPDELAQRWESGYEVDDLRAAVAAAVSDGDEPRLEQLLSELEQRPRRSDWPYDEPSDRDGIIAAMGTAPSARPHPADLADRVEGAWLGRCVGCILGKPLEGVPRDRFVPYLQQTGAYPLRTYVATDEEHAAALHLHSSWSETTLGRIDGVPRDDDLDYTVLGLHIVETYGREFAADDVAREWLLRLPFLQIYTAERAAYRNLILGVRADGAAVVRNPYREWIGAQIRADVYGYVSPGDPVGAALLAYEDARLSHVGNGIYGALWAAALVAAALVADDVHEALEAAAAVVPARSRLAEALRFVDELHERGLEWEVAFSEIEARYGALSWVHTLNNAAAVAAALRWGDGDFSGTIALAVQSGWDTDCNGATAGSVCGALIGARRIPGHWLEPLGDRLRSALFGFDESRLSDLARRTLAVSAG